MEKIKKESPVRERMKKFLSESKISEGLFETSIGMSSGWVSNIGDTIRLKTIAQIAKVYPDLNINWLTSGHGNMLLSKTQPRLEAIPTRLYPDPLYHDDKSQRVITLPDGTIALRVPIVPARAYAGYKRGFADPEYYDDLDDILIGVDKEPGGTYIGFEVAGDSMVCLDSIELAEESIFPGRIAIGRDLDKELWKTRLHTHNYKNWIFVHKTEGILIKQIANHDVANGIITIHSLNPKYKDEDLKLEDMQQIFSVIQIVQRTRPKLK